MEKILDNEQLKTAMSITNYSNKIRKPILYDKTINNSIHIRHWREVIKEELQNLKNYQTWKYNELLPGQKVIKLKWVFKVKFYPDGSVTKFKTKLFAQGFFQV